MKNVYRVLAYAISGLVVIQAAAIAFAVFGLLHWVTGGGTLDKAMIDSQDSSIEGSLGFAIHGIFGYMVIPIAALLFLVSAFFAKIPGGIKWALIVFGAVVVQVLLAGFARGVPVLGSLHGIVALLIFGLAVSAGIRTQRAARGAPVPAAVDA